MRKLTLLIALFVCSLLHANDIIILRNSTRIDAIITEVSDETVKYHKASNPDGPIFVTNTSEISSIVYDNGEVQAFEIKENMQTSEQKTSKLYNSGQGPHFQGMVDLGVDFNSALAGPNLDFTFGSRIRDFIFVGGGFGFFSSMSVPYDLCLLMGAFHANVRGYLPASESTMPYLDFALGMHLGGGIGYNELYYGLYTRVGVGVEYKCLNVGVGYELSLVHNGYLRIGVRF